MAELREVFPEVVVKLVESSGGVFDVIVDGNLVFSKKALGRHAAPGEVVELIRARSGAS